MRILITGTLGFIFSNAVRRLVPTRTGDTFIGLDKAVKPYNLDNTYEHPRYKFYLADLGDAHTLENIFSLEKPDVVIGGAAESFVDNAITDILPFLQSNVIGTQHLVACCLRHSARYLHVSTDEVYGQKLDCLAPGWRETDPLGPRNPYAASKACAEHVVTAAHETHGLNHQIIRSCNVYGPRQKRENLVPQILCSALEGRKVRIHGNGKNFRQYIYVDDMIDALVAVLERGASGGVYNIGDDNVRTNLEMVDCLGSALGRRAKVQHVTDRKAHDFGYRVHTRKLRELGWRPQVPFWEGLERTAQAYRRALQ